MKAVPTHKCWQCGEGYGWQAAKSLHVLWLKREEQILKQHLHLKCRRAFFKANKGAFKLHVATMLEQLPARKTPMWKGHDV